MLKKYHPFYDCQIQKNQTYCKYFRSWSKTKKTKRIDQAIRRKVKVNRQKSAPSVRQKISQELGVIISNQTVRRRLHEIGFYGRVVRKKPYVNKASRIKYLNYAKCMKTRTWTSGNVFYSPMNRNLRCLELIERSWCGLHPKKNFNEHALCQQ